MFLYTVEEISKLINMPTKEVMHYRYHLKKINRFYTYEVENQIIFNEREYRMLLLLKKLFNDGLSFSIAARLTFNIFHQLYDINIESLSLIESQKELHDSILVNEVLIINKMTENIIKNLY